METIKSEPNENGSLVMNKRKHGYVCRLCDKNIIEYTHKKYHGLCYTCYGKRFICKYCGRNTSSRQMICFDCRSHYSRYGKLTTKRRHRREKGYIDAMIAPQSL
jgi:hypothetical protein